MGIIKTCCRAIRIGEIKLNFFVQQHAGRPKTERPLAERIIKAVEEHLLINGGEVHGDLKDIADTFAFAHSGVGLDCNPMMLEFVEELGLPFFCVGTRLRLDISRDGTISLWHCHFNEH